MAAVLSPILVGVPSVKTGGAINSGGFIYTYVAGTTTAFATYTTNALSVQNANPIVLNSFGLAPQEIWWSSGSLVKFIVTDSAGNTIGTYDNLTGINDSGATAGNEWIDLGLTPTYVSGTSFTVPGNQTALLTAGRRLKTTNTVGTVYSTIDTAVFGAATTVTVVNDSSTLDSGLTAVYYGILAASNPSAPTITGLSAGSTIDGLSDYVAMLDTSASKMVKVPLGTFKAATYLSTAASANTGTTTVPILTGLSTIAYSEINVFFEGVSLATVGGADDILLQLIDTSGNVTSGYRARCMTINNTTMASASFTAGFGFTMGNATGTLYGSITLRREKVAAIPGGDAWCINGSLVNGIGTNGQLVVAGTGYLTSATPISVLDGIRLISSSDDTFDAGTIYVTGRT